MNKLILVLTTFFSTLSFAQNTYPFIFLKRDSVGVNNNATSNSNRTASARTEGNLLPDSMVEYYWNTQNNDWRRGDKSIYYYDSKGNDTLNISYRWNTTSSGYENYYKYSLQLNNEGKRTTGYDYYWNKNLTKWDNYYKGADTYDSKGNQIQSISYSWSSNTLQWSNSYKTEYLSNATGKDTTEISYRWDDKANDWTQSYKYTKFYNNQGYVSNIISYRWNKDSVDWIKTEKSDSFYDENGKDTTGIRSYWYTDHWSPAQKNIRKYNSNGKQIVSESYLPNKTISGEWVINSRSESDYDNNGNILSYVSDQDLTFSGKELIKTIKILYYYSNIINPNAISENIISYQTLIYPNPSDGIFTIDNVENLSIKIFNNLGVELYTNKHTQENSSFQFNLTDFKDGIYFVWTSTLEGTKINKIVLKK